MRLLFISCALVLAASAVNAQSDYLLPFALQASLGKDMPYAERSGQAPALYALYSNQAAALSLGAFCRSAFIKENGHYGLSASFKKGKDNWHFHYGYQGFAAWHKQQAGFGYGRNLLPGLGLGLFTACRIDSRIENRPGEIWLDIGLSAAFKRGIWALAFEGGQGVPLRTYQKKEWNQALFLRIGAACNLYKNLHFGIDLYKDLRYPLQGGISFSYAIETARSDTPPFLVYAQARINPSAYKIGFAYTGRRLQAEISFAYQNPVGFETCVGVTVKHLFSKKS